MIRSGRIHCLKWVRYRDDEIRDREVRAIAARSNGRPVPPPANPSIVTFMDKTRQSRLDNDGSFHLAARVRGKFIRNKPGGYSASMRIKDEFLRATILRWQSGVWGLGATCPGCNGSFRTSHVAECRLLHDHDDWTDYVTQANDLRVWFVASKEVLATNIVGFGVIDAAPSKRQWRTAKRMLSDLDTLLPEITDWKGWDAGYSAPAIPASSQDVSTDSDDDLDDLSNDV